MNGTHHVVVCAHNGGTSIQIEPDSANIRFMQQFGGNDFHHHRGAHLFRQRRGFLRSGGESSLHQRNAIRLEDRSGVDFSEALTPFGRAQTVLHQRAVNARGSCPNRQRAFPPLAVVQHRLQHRSEGFGLGVHGDAVFMQHQARLFH